MRSIGALLLLAAATAVVVVADTSTNDVSSSSTSAFESSKAFIPEQNGVLLLQESTIERAIYKYRPLLVLFGSSVRSPAFPSK